ncbi:ATPase [Pseudooceanicola nanhaiensis]|uniref:ATPase n=1 Tax=Pseudooceanicola nanhaiensis TaxID=375761 RepID=UPI0035133B09
MIYETAEDWRAAPHKRVMLFGMSGLGKTHVSTLLRDSGDWFHYSVDYRIGTRYMGEHIADNAKAHAMKVPFLRELLLSDSIYIGSNITFHNLAPLSTYLGKPGDPDKGGLPFEEYMLRQAQHREAEIAAMRDTAHFAARAVRLYDYPHFVCDTSGSICEVCDPFDPADPLLAELSETALLVWIKGSDDHTEELIRRFDRAPKPMYYQPDFLHSSWAAYGEETGTAPEKVDPDAFVRWTYAKALAHRQPRYEALARRGVTVTADAVAAVRSAEEFNEMIARALEAR